MAHPIMVGCDLHDRNMLLKVAVGRGSPFQMSFSNTWEGRERMISRLLEMQKKQAGHRLRLRGLRSGVWAVR